MTLNKLKFCPKHVRLNTELKVKNVKRSAQTINGQLSEAYPIDGSITALAPMTACFFYMH